MKRIPAALLALVLVSAPACGFVQDVVRDPVGATLGSFDSIPFYDDAVLYLFDGVLNVLVLTIVVLDEDTGLEDHPGWVCHFSCEPNDEGTVADIGYLSCANCETDEGIYLATGDTALVVTHGDWRVAEFADNPGAFAASFDMSGDTSWTWTDGTDEIEQTIYVRDAVDIAAFDLTGDDVEVDRIEVAVGETIDIELLPVDAEGHVLAGNYLDVSFAQAVAFSERVSFTAVEGWDDAGTVARITGTAAGESSFLVRCSGVERSIEIVVR